MHCLYLLLLNQITIYGVLSKRLHLKIVVPDVINHHTHTRTVLLHLHMPVKPKKLPKKPKTQQKHEYHHENWSSWSYGRHRDIKDEHEEPELDHEDHHKDHMERLNDKKMPETHKKHREYFPVYDYQKDSYLPPSYVEDNHLESKNRGQNGDSYAVHEDVNDIPPNTETFSYNYEEGYKKGLETESGHLRTDQMHKFHEDQQEEQGDTEDDGFKEDFETKANSGRYLVDDVEYENTRDKREHGRRRRRIYKVST
ncbi:hypothetical protein ANTQUA_LOCUS1395 [Anthophora quadrimaculata]